MPTFACPEFVPGLMTAEEVTDWLNAVVDAQTEWHLLPANEMALDTEDNYWGFFTEWRETLKWAAWDTFGLPEEIR